MMRAVLPLAIAGVAAYILLRPRDAQAARAVQTPPAGATPERTPSRTSSGSASDTRGTSGNPDPVLRSVQTSLTRYASAVCGTGGNPLASAPCAALVIAADGVWGPMTARALRAMAQDAANASLDTRVCTVIAAQRLVFGGNPRAVSSNLEEFSGLLWRLTDRNAWLAADRDLIANLVSRFASTAAARWEGPPAGSLAREIRRLRGLSA